MNDSPLLVRVVFADPKLIYYLQSLKDGKFEDKQLALFVDRALDDLASNPKCGIKIPKTLWPKSYVSEFQIRNLYKYDLPNGWRLLYFIRGSELEVLAIVLDWLSHKDYERKFGY